MTKKKILLLFLQCCDFFSFVLEQFGAIVTAVASKDEALQVLIQSKPDILLIAILGCQK
ncbi:hypothetical protein GXM_04340 [Nostoc sphaeroides CCNUC1]|uniref:Response regulatory domain-containing protein n=1 Tax=Nostoc sphaeroides CCNUC1 TaxID=2653204 RepID=A0A5P8W4C5_9NOSO|nr:hypothetical protein GXM_04340 [Nostoc sphaeroides CCNUC1]